MNKKNLTLTVVLIFVGVYTLLIQKCTIHSEKKEKNASTANNYVGDQACKNCRYNQYKDWFSSDHFDLIRLVENKIPERKDFFYQYYFPGCPELPREEVVITKNYKYMNYIEHNYEELFDTYHDPHKTDNLAKDPKYKFELIQMRSRYNELKAAYGIPLGYV